MGGVGGVDIEGMQAEQQSRNEEEEKRQKAASETKAKADLEYQEMMELAIDSD